MKKSLVFALALMLVLAFASSAMAAQVLLGTPGVDPAEDVTYAPTTVQFVYNTDATVYTASKEYNAGIYLPNAYAPANYRIHANYAKNTDACASCHSTHTAVGPNLLQWYTTREACMACHDGTVTTTYNVEEGNIGTSTSPTKGGAFGNGAENSMSSHDIDNSELIAAAPGGSTVGVAGQSWNVTFGCESCHTPHGNGGNARILHPNPNNVAVDAKKAYYTVDASGFVKDGAKSVLILKGYPYEIKILDAAGAVADTAYVNNGTGVSQVFTGAGVAAGVGYKVYGTPALQVEMTIGSYLQAGETVQHLSGMNAFCGACHTDYNTEGQGHTSDKLTGTYSEAHRHQVGTAPKYNTAANLENAGMVLEGDDANLNNNKLECLTCHVAHGVNDNYWQRTVGDESTIKYLPDTDLVELAGSSALKRLPNMGTCEACHQKAASNQGYTANTDGTARAVLTDVMPNTYNYKITAANYAAADKGWVGNAQCIGCHKAIVDGWRQTAHATSSHTGGCGGCHNPGNTIMGSTGGVFATANAGNGLYDAGITCESCHGSGANHVAAPSKLNIFNPADKDIERQAIECGRCHDMYNNPEAGSFGSLAATSGSDVLATSVKTTQQMQDAAGWSVAFRAYNDDPTKFADASQLGAKSTHYGGAWGYADSKHFLGAGGTASAPNGIVSCTTCHDMHSDTVGLLKYDYTQVCASCHDTFATIGITMPTNNWNRHQIEANDFAHSFQFGAAATIAALDITTVNLESATNGIINAVDLVGGVPTFYSTYDATYGASGRNNLWRSSQTGGGGVGQKVVAWQDDLKTTRAYNNYELEWEVVSHPAGVVEGVDFEFLTEAGALEFTNPTASGQTPVMTDYDKFTGDYVIKYTSIANPSLTDEITIHVQPIQD